MRANNGGQHGASVTLCPTSVNWIFVAAVSQGSGEPMNDRVMLGEEFASTLAAAQAGAQWAIAELYRAHQPRLLRYLRAQAGQAAEDIASETWLDAARNLTSFEGDEDALRGWLFTIARRRLTDHHRRARVRPSTPTDDTRTLDAPTPSAETDALGGGLGDEAARRIVSVLPAEQAEIVLLRVVAGLDVAQVAEITGRRPGTVRVLQHRALRRLARDVPGEV
jgi:RNA polymerase sigma-70 factor (ECF subfamily)